MATSVPKTARCLTLPQGREYVRVKSIGRLVGDAIDEYTALQHEGDIDAIGDAALGVGFENRSLELDTIVLAVLELRNKGLIKVFEKDGLGTIYDDDVGRGYLSRDDFAILLATCWNVSLLDEQGEALEVVAGSVAALADDLSNEQGGLKRRERQIRAIILGAQALGFDPLAVPKDGKKKLMNHCKVSQPELFGAGDDPFKDAWKEAGRSRLRMKEHDSYASRNERTGAKIPL